MKKGKIVLFGIISALLLFVLFIPIKTEAAAIIKSGKTIALKDFESAPLYKFTLEEDSVVTVSWINNFDTFSTVNVYSDSKANNVTIFSFMESVKGKEYFAFKKGVYYVKMYDQTFGGPTTKITISWTPVSTYDQGNYCADKAVTLSANKTTRVVQTPGCNYERFYKIKIKAPKKVDVIVTYEAIQIVPYKAKIYFHLYSEDFSQEYNIYDDVLPAGTYYLVADPIPKPYFHNSLGSYITFKWK